MSEISVAAESFSPSDPSEPISQSVVDAVAGAEGVDPLDLEDPLYEVVDPDALDALFQSESAAVEGHVEFRYYGYEVTVTGSGHVSLEAVDDR